MSILEVKNVSIRYMTGDFKEIGLKEYVLQKLQGRYHATEFWADKNISFKLEKGDMLGIIGTNGAGKSTLLKCVSGIMEPTRGSVRREGNIAALLELASGFDGDLTVKENTYLRGALLGYTRRFMDETYEQIIDFAELKEFENRPFKQLSSGMKSRLAFAIASLVHPDVLILDEVLSVGDGAFRRKSEAKMREIISGGATTILVSHSIGQIRALCNKVLWLHKGEQVEFGDDVQGICDRYQEFLNNTQSEGLEAPDIRLVFDENGKPVLNWQNVVGATQYEVHVSAEPDWRGAKVVTTSYRQMIHSTAQIGSTYYYRARALFGDVYGPFSDVKTAVCEKTPPAVSVSLDSSGKPVLNWTGGAGDTKFEVWYSLTGEDGVFSKLVTSTYRRVNHSSAISGETYYYKVRAVCDKDADETNSFSKVISIAVK